MPNTTLFANPFGAPTGAVGYGRFTAEERALAAAGDRAFEAKVRAAQAAVPAPKSREDMYADLFGAVT